MEAIENNARSTFESINESSLLKPVVLGVLSFLAFIFVMYMLIRLFDKKRIGVVLIDVPVEPKSQPFICTKKIISSETNETTYSFWTYIKSWSTSDEILVEAEGKEPDSDDSTHTYLSYIGKMIFKRQFDNFTEMFVTFSKEQPELIIYIKKPCENVDDKCEYTIEETDGTTQYVKNNEIDMYVIKDIRLQTWNHFVISLWGRTMDIYLNGHLVRTFVIDTELFPHVPEELTVGEEETKTYDGYISRFTYYPRVITPQEVKKIYYKGPAKRTFSILPTNPIAKVNMSLSSNPIWNQ